MITIERKTCSINYAIAFLKIFLCLFALLFSIQSATANPQDTVWVRMSSYDIRAGVAFSNDSKYIATAGDAVSVWETATGTELYRYPIKAYSGNLVYGNLKWSKSGKYLLFGCEDQYCVVDCNTWKIVTNIFSGDESACMTIDDKYVVTGKAEGYLSSEKGIGHFQIWDLLTGKLVKTIDKSNCPAVTTMKRIHFMNEAKDPDKIYWLSYSSSGLTELNISTNRIDTVYNNANGGNKSTIISRDGALAGFEPIVSGSYIYSVIDLNTRQIIFTIPGKQSGGSDKGISGVSFSSDNRYLAVSNNGAKLNTEIWDLQTKQVVYTYTTIPSGWGFEGTALSGDGKYTACVSGKYFFLFNFHNSVSVENNKSTIDKVYPNPNNGTATVSITIEHGMPVVISLITLTGQKLEKYSSTLDVGHFDIPIDISGLSSGTYLVEVQKGSNSQTYNLIINN